MQNSYLRIEVPTQAAESRDRDFFGVPPEAGYFGPESGRMKDRKPAATAATDGGGSVAERTCRSLLGAAHSILDKNDVAYRVKALSSEKWGEIVMQKNWTKKEEVPFDKKGAQRMNETAKTVFAPVYPVIAQNALSVTGISHGVCLDLGSGPGMLAISVARAAPGMKVISFDFSGDAREIARGNIKEAGFSDRIEIAEGDVHAMPFEDGYADLIVSRGSMFFWDDLKEAFQEIFRVLARGGATYIGGGFGSRELRERVIEEMLKRDPEWDCYAKKKADENDLQRFREMFEEIGVGAYRIIDDETGFWIVLKKRA
ncbi:MAG: class I SAM-dependent methyltransferase [Desulfatiglandales bacterium]